jgi:hypothetical protein
MALYVFSSSSFTTDKTVTIGCLTKDPSSPLRYRDTPMECSGTFTLAPGAYRVPAGVSIRPTVLDSPVKPAGFKFIDTNTKTNYPDPPTKAASGALGIPIDALKPFLFDAGELSELADEEDGIEKRANA